MKRIDDFYGDDILDILDDYGDDLFGNDEDDEEPIIDTCNVKLKPSIVNGRTEDFEAISDIFKSVTGDFYMTVKVNGNFVPVKLDKISEIDNKKMDGLKKSILRDKKLNRINKK